MGLDWKALGVPLDAPAVRLLQQDAAAWEESTHLPPFFWEDGERAAFWEDAETAALPKVNTELLAVLPEGLREWEWMPASRGYEQVEYLLDPVAYAGSTSFEEREMGEPYRIVHGCEDFAPHARGGQGIPWRCSARAFLTHAVSVIDAIEPARLREQFSVAQMVEQGVYKADQTAARLGEDDRVFSYVLQSTRWLRDRYALLVRHGLDVLIEVD